MSNSILAEIQANKLATLANDIPGGYVSVMFDLDQEDENGSKQKCWNWQNVVLCVLLGQPIF
jgi:hypothetical protein